MAKTPGRDNFSAKTRRDLANRAGHVCCFPGCDQPTSGPGAEPGAASVDVGEACHVAAAAGGPGARRYDPAMTSAERKSIANGIWMCRTHAKLIDSDEATYTVAQLHEWKRQAEAEAERRLRTAAARAGAGTMSFHLSPFGVTPAVWNVPHLRNPHFTGRDQLLGSLHRTLTSGRPAALTQTLRGLGGVGKTQTALEYVYRHAADYRLVWWLAAEEPATLARDLAALAVELKLVAPAARDQQAAVAAARRWLEGHAGWLLVFDNAEDPRALRAVLPRGGGGHAIITSRRTDWGRVGALAVEPFAREESVRFLEARGAGDGQPAAGELAGLLGDLPLALEQAAAYRSETGISTARYLELFRARRRDLLARGVPEDHPQAVATTWDLSFETLEAASPAAAALLRLAAFLAPDDIPRSLLAEHAGNLPEPLAAAAGDPVARLDAVAAARRFSLLEADGDALSMHRLVQAIARDRCHREQRRRWSQAAVALLAAAYRYDEHDLATWELAGRLLPHVRAALGHLEEAGASKPAARLLNETGVYLLHRGALGEARRHLEQSLEIAEAVWGKDHPNVAIRANNIGQILQDQGDLDGALVQARRALEIDEAVYGKDHPSVAIFVNNIAVILKEQGDLDAALVHARRALEIDQAVYGKDHPNVATDANNIGLILKDQGDLDGAREQIGRALAIFERVYGPDHPQTVIVRDNLAAIPGAAE